MVEIALSFQVPIHFINRVEEVGYDDENENISAMALVARVACLGERVTGADGYAVVECLEPSGDELFDC